MSRVTRIILATVALLLNVVATTANSAVARTYDVPAAGIVDASASEARLTATSHHAGVWTAPTAAPPRQLAAATTGSEGSGCTYDACSITRVDARAYEYGGDVSPQVSGSWNETGSRSWAKSGTSTTTAARFVATNTADDLAEAASRAASNVGPGSGSVYGTRVHSAFADEIAALGRSDLFSEVSYLNGQVVPYGTRGSVRLDVVVGSPSAPTAIWDLKTGAAALTPARIAQIQSHLPPGFQNVPVLEVRP